jgi:hypothetical protein
MYNESTSPNRGYYENIFAQIRTEKDNFINNDIYPVSGYNFNQYKTIKRIHLYSNSRFENGQYYLGKEKIFFDINTNPTELAATMLDFDTRHIKPYSNVVNSYWKTFLFNKEAEYYFKKNGFASMLNELATNVARYGSAVIQKTGKKLKMVDLRKLIIDPSVEKLTKSRFIIIEHDYTPSELREVGEENGWDMEAVEEAISKFGNINTPNSYIDEDGSMNTINSTPYIKVCERWGEVPERWFGGKSNKMIKSIFFTAGYDSQSKNEKGEVTGEDGVVLFKSKWHKEYPFKDFHYTKTAGRWLGVGIVEKLFPVQIRFNELKNQQRFAMELSSKHIFQTRDRSAFNNILTDVDNGQILLTKGEITPIVNEERNMAAFGQEEQTYYKQAQDLTFAYEGAKGNFGAETTATTSIISSKATSSIFDFKRENIGNSMRDFLNDFVRDEIIKDITPEHVLIFTGNIEQLNQFDDQLAQAYTNNYFIKRVTAGDMEIDQMQLDDFKKQTISDLKRGRLERKTLIEKDWYKDADIWLDFNVSNEAIDPTAMFQNSNSVLIALAQNPTILQDPRLKLIFYKYMESLGINPTEIELAEQSVSTLTNQGQMGEMGQIPEAQVTPEVMTGTSNMPGAAKQLTR